MYQQLLEQIGDYALFRLDAEGCIALWPAGAESLYGYEAADLIGQPVDVLCADTQAATTAVERLLAEAQDEPVETEGWHERADGSVFWAIWTLTPLTDDAGGGYGVVSKDTTSRKQYEQMLEHQNDRLNEFGDILSHELRTPLSVVVGRLEMYRHTGEDHHLETAEATIDRMEGLIEDLLRVARHGEVVDQPTPTDLGPIIETAKEGTLPAAAAVSYEPVPTMMADPDRLIQLIENLLRNSVEHSTDSPTRAGNVDDAGVTVRVGPLEDGFYVEDDGPGIPPEDRDRVFDHGFSTTEDGTGYGLSIVRTIAGAHGWDIVVTDAAAGGVRFEITGIEFVPDA